MNQLELKGARPSKPTRYGVLWTNRFFQGIWTQRNPLRDAGSTRLEETWYGARGDALIDGLNTEISAGLTLVRRPGSSVYNSATIGAVNRYYSNHLFNSDQEKIQVLADTSSNIYDVSASNSAAASVFSKSAGAASTYFQSVGNNCYFSDGVDQKKIVNSLLSWAASTTFTQGQYIIISGQIYLNIGSQTASISNISISSGVLTLFFSPTTSIDVPVGTQLALTGLTTVPALNGTTITVSSSANSYQVSASTALGDQSYASETGSATTGNGVTGATEPSWNGTLNSITVDAGAQWENRGPNVQNWGIATPISAPIVTQVPAPTIYGSWVTDTWYAPLFVILDSNNNLQRLTTEGTTGASAPTWAAGTGATTTDGTAVWTNLGPSAWAASTAYAVGAAIQAQFTYYITVPQGQWVDVGGQYVKEIVYVQQPVIATGLFECVTAGTSGASTPSWTNGVGTTVNDGTVVWKNEGTAPSWPGASQALSLYSEIVDSNGNLQIPQSLGKSGASAPTWNTTTGGYTVDGTLSWLNQGGYGASNTGAWLYAYSFVNSVTDTVGTASAESSPILVSLKNLAVIQGTGSSDVQCDIVYLWRTVQGGSQLFYLDQIPNPGSGQKWVYTDTTPDTGLNELIEAPIDGVNNPPPTGLSALTYHLQRIFGAVNNTVYFSQGPDVLAGNGNEAWSASNSFVFPDTVTRMFPTSSGLLVFTVSDIYIIQGLGTTSSPLYSAPFLQGIGLASYDAFAVNGSIVFLYTSDNQVLSLDPSSGVSEVGFPIGDQFGPLYGTTTFTPSSAKVTWHVSGSPDKGLYVSDSQGTWWRLCPTPAPETGLTWSAKAQLAAGFSAVQSVETTPGTYSLLIGPKTSGPILERDSTVWSDNGSAYSAYSIIGSLVLAQPGQLATAAFITTDSVKVGSQISLAVQLDEIAPMSAGYFEDLPASVSVTDPTQLTPSLSTYAQRFYLSNTQLPALCRHLQIKVDFGTDTVQNELLAMSVFGAFSQEK